MNSLSAIGYFSKFPVQQSATSRPRRFCARVPYTFSALKTSPPSATEFAEDEVFRAFMKERELTGDFISKMSDKFWTKDFVTNSENQAKYEEMAENPNNATQLLNELSGEENDGGFLKLKRTYEWLSVDGGSVPTNKKMVIREIQDNSERRKRLNFLQYEALKRELLLLTVGIGCACGGYCLITLSVQAALSYMTGVFFSCLYFQLLCRYADSISRENVPQMFRKKKLKKIGIRSEDLQDLFERSVKGCGIALSSPRLVLPAAIYGLWELSQNFGDDIFYFQLVPAMVGLFAYKAAALVQVYRDNEDLQFVFPDNKEDSSD